MDTTTQASIEAGALLALMPKTYFHGVFYPVNYQGQDVKISRTRGRGKHSHVHTLHMTRPCKIHIKDHAGNVLRTEEGFSRWKIELFTPSALWKRED